MTVSMFPRLFVRPCWSSRRSAPVRSLRPRSRPWPEPLIGTGSTWLPAMAVPATVNPLTDELAPLPDPAIEAETPATDPQPPTSQGQPGDLTSLVSQLRSSDAGQPRARMPRRRDLFRIQERAALRPARRRPCHRQPRKSGRFPSSYCGVVFQRSQFSFVRGRSLPPSRGQATNGKPRSRSRRSSIRRCTFRRCRKALFFHARRVSPGWRLTRVGTVGNHVFYR